MLTLYYASLAGGGPAPRLLAGTPGTPAPPRPLICLVGEDIRGRVGIASEVFGVLAAGGINIRMIAQGSSEISVSFVVEEKDAVKSVQQLHRHLFELASPTPSHASPTAAHKTAQA